MNFDKNIRDRLVDPEDVNGVNETGGQIDLFEGGKDKKVSS